MFRFISNKISGRITSRIGNRIDDGFSFVKKIFKKTIDGLSTVYTYIDLIHFALIMNTIHHLIIISKKMNLYESVDHDYVPTPNGTF